MYSCNSMKVLMKKKTLNIYSTKLENLKKMNEFLDTYILPKSSQCKLNNLNGYIITNEIEEIIKIYQAKKQLK